MTANELLENILTKINSEIDILLDDSDNEELIGNDISGELTIENFTTKSEEYLEAIKKLVINSVSIKLFLEKSLITLSKLATIPDIEINENFKVSGVHRDLLQNIYINNNPIDNQFFKESKILIIEKLHVNFETFIDNLLADNDSNLLFVLKVCFDNFDYEVEPDIHRLIFLPNCTNEDIQNYNENKNELVSYLKLCMLSEGLNFHKHFSLSNPTSNQNFSCDGEKNYAQYNEILYILSEYNYSNDLLNKYFLLYTIIENFMYRKPIAHMIRNNDDFSIRDFKRFYAQIEGGELNKIGSLFSDIMLIECDGQTIIDDVKSKLDIFSISDTDNELIEFLLKIGISNKSNIISYSILLDSGNNFVNLKGNEKAPGYFAKIVYQLRNSILHNTATEFHITHYELSRNEIIVKFLQDFMIPILEKIILHLIFTNNELISYEKNALILYDSNR